MMLAQILSSEARERRKFLLSKSCIYVLNTFFKIIYIQMADASFSELFPPLHGNCYVFLGSSASRPAKVG